MRKTQLIIVGFENGRETRGQGIQLLEGVKGKKMDSHLKLPECGL